MQRKNYFAVLVGILALAALVASGCTPEVPTGNYDQGGNTHALTTMLGMIQGAFIPGAGRCNDVIHDIKGKLVAEPGEGEAPIMYLATPPEGEDNGTCPDNGWSFLLSDVSPALPDNEGCTDVGVPDDCCTGEGTGDCTVTIAGSVLGGIYVNMDTMVPSDPIIMNLIPDPPPEE